MDLDRSDYFNNIHEAVGNINESIAKKFPLRPDADNNNAKVHKWIEDEALRLQEEGVRERNAAREDQTKPFKKQKFSK